ncbi:MAG: hypothetical protein U0074_17930 [Kouleothrix sp.]
MLAVLGSVGIGLVWGWMLSHPGRSWRVGQALTLLLGLVVQALLLWRLVVPLALIAFAGALAASWLVARIWYRALALRYR